MKVKSKVEFSGVPQGTTGIAEKDENDLYKVTWDLVRTKPLVDWFNEFEMGKYLEEEK